MGRSGAELTIFSDSRCLPHAEKLFLHSGALDADDSPFTDAQPVGRKRDKATLQAKVEFKKRKLEEQVVAMDKTPTKKVSSPLFLPFCAIMAHTDSYRLVATSLVVASAISMPGLKICPWRLMP